jgi:hypothetical protein
MDANKDDVGDYEIPFYVPGSITVLRSDYVHLDIFNEVMRAASVLYSAATPDCICHLLGCHSTRTEQVLDVNFASIQLMLDSALCQALKDLPFRLSISHSASVR